MSYAGIFTDKNNADHPVTSTLYGTCDTAAATAAKVVTCADVDVLTSGMTIRVKFANANTAASPTINVNSTGAKTVYRFGTTAPVDGDSWKAGEVVELLYDGTYFCMVSADDIGSKQDTLTFDDTPTDGSNNPVKSNGIYDSEKDIYAAMGEMGAKNLIPYPYYESNHTESGITWTVNSDGSVTANGTATADSTFTLRYRAEQIKFVEKNTSYILSGCPSGGSNSKYHMRLFVKNQDDSNIVSGNDYGDGATINMPDQDYYGIYAFARVISGQTVSDLTFKPMLRLASDTDNTYQPYAKTNKQLTDNVALKQDKLTFDDIPTDGSNNPVKSNGIYDSEKDIYAAIGKMGAKNLIPYPYVFRTSVNRGITFTANNDGTVSFSGTADNANPSAVNMITRSMYKLKKGSYILSGGSDSYGGTSIFFYDYASGTNYTGNYTGLLKNSSNQVYIYTTLDGDKPTSTNLYGYDKTFTIDKDAYVDIAVRSMTNSYAQSVSGVIYPMLRLASDTDGTYQPYAKTNKQLTDDVVLLDSEKANTDIVASDFDATASYTAGNYCIYEGKFYKFKNNHSGAWYAADVDEIKIAGELSALKSGLTNVSHASNLGSGGSITIAGHDEGYVRLIVVKREIANIFAIVASEYWSGTVISVFGTLPDSITITKTALSNDIVITNNTSAAIAYLVIN